MFRYLAFVWNPSDPKECEAAQWLLARARETTSDWLTAAEGRGLAVLVSGMTKGSRKIYHLHNEAGVVLGALFERSGAESREAPRNFAADETSRILRSGGRALVDGCWGRYVAFLHDSVNSAAYVLRDPSAGLPCLSVQLESVEVYFSWIEDAVRLGLRASVNWPFIAAALCYLYLRVQETGIQDVHELIGGECVCHYNGRRTRMQLWNPLAFASKDPIDDLAIARRELRQRVQDSVHVWAAQHDSVLHLLSGGLDSSIVLSCLATAPSSPRVTCLNLHYPGKSEDEREYARVCAIKFDRPLIERARDIGADLRSLLAVHRSAAPDNYLFYVGESAQAQIALDHQATAVTSGWGGDQLFYQSSGAASAAEYIGQHGLASGWLRVALDAARLDRTSLWDVIGHTSRQLLTSRPWRVSDEAGHFRELVPPEVISQVASDERFVLPWFRSVPRGIPTERIWHAYALSTPLPFHTPFVRPEDPDHVEPLYTQPLIELVLRIPTYLLTIRGWDRGLARRTFKDDLPAEIVTRVGKCTQDAYAQTVLTRNSRFVREILLDGQLVAHGLVKREAVETAFSGRPSAAKAYVAELFGALSVEVWLQRWSSLGT